MGRAPCCDKANVKKGPWAPEEDSKLKSYIQENGTGGNWIALPQKIGLRRCGKSCRLRWLNYLRPNLKHGGFSVEEDSVICRLYISIGSRWSIIAAQLPGRTDNDIKNYWNTKLKKRLLGKHRGSSDSRGMYSSDDTPPDGRDSAPQALSSSAIERMQLHMQLQGLNSPFSYYNNPLPWPKSHPLPTISQGGHTDTVSLQPADSNVTAAQSDHEPFLPNWSSENIMQHDQFHHSNSIGSNGLSSPSRNIALGGIGLENSSSSIDSEAARIQAELHDLLYNENTCSFVRQESHQVSELDRLRESDDEQVNCWINNYIEEKSLHGTWGYTPVVPPESVFHQ